MNIRKKGTQKEFIDVRTREQMITYSQIINYEKYYIDVTEDGDFIAAAGIPER
jgi:hypothetical protein